MGVQISSFAVLCDYVAVIDAEVYILAFYDIWVVQARQEGGFAAEQSGCDFTLDVCDSDLFNCDDGVVVDVGAPIDLAEAAFAHFVSQMVDVVLYFFDHLELFELGCLHGSR